MNPDASYDLLERIGNLLRAAEREASTARGLQPVHLAALWYLSRANRYSDKPTAVAEYLGLTKGTVSQSLLLLEREGYLSKSPDSRDRRAAHLSVTESGKRLLRNSLPPDVVKQAFAGIAPTERGVLKERLTELLLSLQRANGSRSFGVCRSCRFFTAKPTAQGLFQCGLTGERLSAQDTGRICREHEPTTQTDRRASWRGPAV